MGDDEGKDLSQLGVFSYVKPVSVGDKDGPNPYGELGQSAKVIHQISGVRQFVTSPQKKGQTAGNFGGGPRKFERLYEGEVYRNPQEVRVKDKLKAKEKNINERGFIPSSPGKIA